MRALVEGPRRVRRALPATSAYIHPLQDILLRLFYDTGNSIAGLAEMRVFSVNRENLFGVDRVDHGE